MGFGALQELPKLSNSNLQGTWGENPHENAYFTIGGDSIYYLEDGPKGYHYLITGNNQLAISFSYGI